MYELSLFTGIGGGLLGTFLLGWTPIGYVEWDDYCQRIIAQRIADGYLPNAPIFGDVRAFISEGYAASYTGLVDVVTAGFPCQPFSIAGKRRGADDSRNMWPATIETIRIVKPRYVFLENVPGIISSGYIITVCNELRETGYKTLPPFRLSASDVGAPHKRERIFLVAYSNSARRQGLLQHKSTVGTKKVKPRKLWGNSLDSTDAIANEFRKSMGQPAVFGMDDGLPYRVDRLKAIGNGQVSAVVRTVWKLLTE